MKRDQGIVAQLIEVLRLARHFRMSLKDALDLLIDQLNYFEEAERREEDLQHAEFPRHIYGY